MTPIIHTTRPPNDDTFIVRLNATASQMDPTVGWPAVSLSAATTRGKFCQSPTMKWGAEVVPHNGIWHITATSADDAPSCWLYASDLPALIAAGLSAQIAAGPDLAPQLAAAEARVAVLEAAIQQLNKAVTSGGNHSSTGSGILS